MWGRVETTKSSAPVALASVSRGGDFGVGSLRLLDTAPESR